MFNVDLQQYAPEAVDNARFKFKDNCQDILTAWPLPIAGTSLGKGE